ncbi:MAG: DNA-directed RNA polymerase specialized sigma24 family protein [Myxococcota bacterium]|jgi:DNA-directed RNA polymerase specialized sigma24 family protein
MTLHFRGSAWTPALHRRAEQLGLGILERIEATMDRADDGFFDLKLLHRPPGREVITHDRSEHAALALDGAFGALRRELDAPTIAEGVTPLSEACRRRLSREVLPAARRIAHHAVLLGQQMGDFELGEVDPDELVDMAAAELFIDAAEVPSETLVDRFDAQIHAILAARAVETESRSGDLSTERRVEPRRPTGTRTLWTELQSFWVLDERMHLEDLIEDTSAKNPALLLEGKEVRHVLVTALFALPKQTRQMFGRVVTDGADPAALAELHETSRATIEGIVADAASQLAAAMPRLSGGRDDTVRTLYRELGDKLRGLPRH